jgi:hypothetical protein
MPINTPKRISDKAKPWIIKAIKEHGQDDQVTWDFGLATFPDPSATDPMDFSTDPSAIVALIPALVLYLEIPTGDPTTPAVYMNAILAPYNFSEQRVNDAIEATLQTLRDAREKHLKDLLDKS